MSKLLPFGKKFNSSWQNFYLFLVKHVTYMKSTKMNDETNRYKFKSKRKEPK